MILDTFSGTEVVIILINKNGSSFPIFCKIIEKLMIIIIKEVIQLMILIIKKNIVIHSLF